MVAFGEPLVTSWFLSSGVVGFFVLLLVSIFLTALCSCSDCRKSSFQLKDTQPEKKDSALISVVKIEETRQNPMMSQIQKSEKDAGVTKESPVHIIPWRSHLKDPPCSDIFSLSNQAPNDYVYPGRRGINGSDASSPLTVDGALDLNDPDRNSVFAAYTRSSQKRDPPHSPAGVKEGAEPGAVCVVLNITKTND